MKALLCFGIVLSLVIASTAVDCERNSCKQNHTLCKYPNPNPASACGSVISYGFTDDEKAAIVQEHNSLRVYVAAGLEKRGINGPQPPAQGMKTLIWDEGLAEVAQRWSNQCQFAHDECRNDEADEYIGQNIAWYQWYGEAPPTVEKLVQSWYDEVKYFDETQTLQFTGKDLDKVGHYTQVVWANTDRIGCGKIQYKSRGSIWSSLFLVCNYGPGGNIIDSPIYENRQA